MVSNPQSVFCVSVAKISLNPYTDIVLLYNVATYRRWEGL